MTDFPALRDRMVLRDLAARGIDDPSLLAAFRAVPREAFVRKGDERSAYADCALPIAHGQTISQPYIVALTIAAAGIDREDSVLEVGAGSGYAAAILGQVAKKVVAIERHEALAQAAAERIARLGYGNIRILVGDGTLGCPAEAPFDAIVVAATGSRIPPPLIAQLKPGGRLVMPVGKPGGRQSLVKLTKEGDGDWPVEDLGAVRFVPLIGAEA